MRRIEFRARWRDNLKPVEDFDCRAIYELNEDFIVEQFTGLTDKNGVKIFEGDIVHLHYTNKDKKLLPVRKIVFMEGKFVALANIKRKSAQKYSECIIDTDMHLWGNKEVIGNIHDNPELMEAQ